MEKSVKKIILIGLDGASPQIIDHLIKKGLLKNIAKLIKKGTFIDALCPYPTITASNWTTIATGAWPGRHGVTGYNVHHPGDSLDKIYSGFNTAECATEHIWEAAEKVGKKSILVNYETSWPPTIKEGIVIDGGGPNFQDDFHKITPDIVFTNEAEIYEFAYSNISITDSDTVKINKSNKICSAILKFRTSLKEEKEYFAEWNDESEEITIFKNKKKSKILTSVKKGNWSEPAFDKFLFDGKKVDTVFKFKLIHLPDKENDSFKLLCTSMVPTNEFTYPKSLGPELVEKFGPYHPRGGWESSFAVDPETYQEYIDMYNNWITKASKYLLAEKDWDIFFAITHTPDYVNHLYMRYYDPITKDKGPFSQEQCISYMERAYESTDKMVGEILEHADDETLVVVVSDHGGKAWLFDIDIRQILIDKGLMVVNPDNGQVIWEKTKAVPQRACYVYVNLKGRDPQGIVEPGEEYESVRNQIIEAFYDYVEPNTKLRPFSLALKSEDARVLGLYGPRIGDIVYALNAQFGHEHGQGLPTSQFGIGSLGSAIIMAGPGIKKGFRHKGMTGIQDIVPTLCYMADIPFPDGCEGAIIYDALEDPSFKMRKITKLEEALEKLKYAYERQVSITHSRF